MAWNYRGGYYCLVPQVSQPPSASAIFVFQSLLLASGCGKTMLAQAIAVEANISVHSVTLHDIIQGQVC